MITFRKMMDKVDRFFQNYHVHILFFSLLNLVLTAYLHIELIQNNKDLIYWKDFIESIYNELEYFALMMIMLVVIIKVIFLVFMLFMNNRPTNWFDELSQLEIKKRYADFLFLRLIVDIDRIEKKYLTQLKKNNKGLEMEALMLAHDDMRSTVDTFRRDVRKLLTPNEVEIQLPIEEVYCILESDERAVRQSRFYNMNITANEKMLKKLLNP